MSHRWWGAMVVAVVLVAAIVAPSLSTDRVAGHPVARAVTGPPAIGACATLMADRWGLYEEPASGADDVIDFPSADFGPCDGPIVGEVMSVNTSAEPPDRIAVAEYQTETSPCTIDAIGYTGSIAPVVDGSSGQPGTIWVPELHFDYTLIGPDLAQRAAGQRWSACIIGPDDGRSYTGRLENVLTSGWLPPEFGECLSPLGPSGFFEPTESEPTRCDRPHSMEMLGSTRLGPGPVSAADLQRACTVYAGRAMRADDPTRAGVLTVEIVTVDSWVHVIAPTAETLQDTYVACVVTGQHGVLFNGSLVGIADRPLPLA